MQIRNMFLAIALCMVAAAPVSAITFEYLTAPVPRLGGFDLT
jgi:hypothetical protein